jgi:hypothetical protein
VRVYLNYAPVRGAYGGANSFLRTLHHALERCGVSVTLDVADRFDVALLNALTDGIDADFARAIAERGIPVVHRKVGYRASGGPDLRAVGADGVVHGDRLQLEFSPWLAHTIFQSDYSRDVFVSGGFDGPHSVIHNGVDERVFNQQLGGWPFRRRRSGWDRNEPLRIAISTWSKDALKGFAEYERIDAALGERVDVDVTLFGRVPEYVSFRRIRVEGPLTSRELARRLKSAHALLTFSQFETCSNALIEGINCGLPAIYLDSGSNAELAREYGVEYQGDFGAAVDALRARYDELFDRTLSNPYRASRVAEQYLSVLEHVQAQR